MARLHYAMTLSMSLMAGCSTLPFAQPAAPVTMLDAQSHDLTLSRIRLQHSYGAQHPVVALVLGSGGARGYAHIGVIQALEAQGIRPDLIVGTSAGSIVGALYASGKNADELKNIAMSLKASDVRDFTADRKGFFDGQKIENYVNAQVNHVPLEQLKIPMFVVATELKTGRQTVFSSGNTGQAVRASASIPSMFVPAKIADREYVDGGLVDPVPVDVARKLGANIVIAVDILAQPQHTATTNMWGLFNQNINIMQKRLADDALAQADVVIQPDIREKQHIFDTKSRQQTMQAGEEAALAKLPEIQNIMHLEPKGLKAQFQIDTVK